MDGASAMDTPAVRALEHQYRRLRRQQALVTLVCISVFVACVVGASVVTGVTPIRVIRGLPGLGGYFAETVPDISLATFFADIAAWYADFWHWLGLLFDTMLIALMASLTGVVGALLLSFSASRNLMSNTPIYFASRRLLELARTVPEVVYALIFVVAFGVGPLAGYLALSVHSIGGLGKLYAEVNENIDTRPVEGLAAAGGNWFERIRYAVVPQVLPGYTSYTLWRVELNLRAAAIVGFVGAGGIGQELYTAISWNNYQDVSAILIMLVTTVIVLDLTSEVMRNRLLGREKN